MKDNNNKIQSILKQVMIFNDFYEEVIQSNFAKNQSPSVSKLEFRMLHTVYRHHELTISDLSDLLNISLPNCSRYIKTAIADGYLQKQIDSDDKRVYYISLTEKGKNIVDNTLNRFSNEMSQQLIDLDVSSLEKLDQSMANLNSVLSETLLPATARKN